MDKSNPTVNTFCSIAAGVAMLAASLGCVAHYLHVDVTAVLLPIVG